MNVQRGFNENGESLFSSRLRCVVASLRFPVGFVIRLHGQSPVHQRNVSLPAENTGILKF